MEFMLGWPLISPTYLILRLCLISITSAKILDLSLNSPVTFGPDSLLLLNATSKIFLQAASRFCFFRLLIICICKQVYSFAWKAKQVIAQLYTEYRYVRTTGRHRKGHSVPWLFRNGYLFALPASRPFKRDRKGYNGTTYSTVSKMLRIVEKWRRG